MGIRCGCMSNTLFGILENREYDVRKRNTKKELGKRKYKIRRGRTPSREGVKRIYIPSLLFLPPFVIKKKKTLQEFILNNRYGTSFMATFSVSSLTRHFASNLWYDLSVSIKPSS